MNRIIGTVGTIIFLLIAGFVAGTSYRTIKGRQDNAAAVQTVPASLRIIQLHSGSGRRTIPALATIKSRATIKIMPEIAGKVTFLNKREGDLVASGEVIARIEGDELQTQLRVAGAQSNSVEKQTIAAEETIRSLSSQRPALAANERFWRAEAERDRKLFEQGALSMAQSESTANKLAEAEGKLAALDAQISASRAQKSAVASQKDAAAQNVALWKVRNRYAEVTAPVAGIISSRVQEVGNYVTPNTVLYQLEDTSATRLVLQIPQQYSGDVKPGMRIVTSDDGLSGANGFLVTRIHPTVNELRQRVVEAESASSPMASEIDRQMAVQILVAEATGTILPPDAFFQNPFQQKNGADSISYYLVEGATATRREQTPQVMGDTGEAVIDAAALPATAQVVQLGFLQYGRYPETIVLQGGSR